jgi:hypothetical protein
MISEPWPDVIQRAKEVYDTRLKTELEKHHLHDFVAIEPDSGTYYLGKTLSEAAMGARQAQPGKPYYLMRVGHQAAVHIGTMS